MSFGRVIISTQKCVRDIPLLLEIIVCVSQSRSNMHQVYRGIQETQIVPNAKSIQYNRQNKYLRKRTEKKKKYNSLKKSDINTVNQPEQNIYGISQPIKAVIIVYLHSLLISLIDLFLLTIFFLLVHFNLKHFFYSFNFCISYDLTSMPFVFIFFFLVLNIHRHEYNNYCKFEVFIFRVEHFI